MTDSLFSVAASVPFFAIVSHGFQVGTLSSPSVSAEVKPAVGLVTTNDRSLSGLPQKEGEVCAQASWSGQFRLDRLN